LKLIPAPLILLIILAFQSCTQEAPSIYAQYMNYPAIGNSLRSNPGGVFTKANEAYQKRRFSEAVAVFKETKSPLLRANLYYGISLMETEQYGEARDIFVFELLKEISDQSPLYKRAAELIEKLG